MTWSRPPVGPGGGRDRLLEREVETGLLTQAIDAALAGRGSLVVVEGPAGVGKSRLIDFATDEADRAGLQVVAAQGGRLESDFPFAVAIQLFDAAGLVEADWAPDQGESGAMHRCLDRLHRLVADRAAQAPLALVVDDAHWADRSSLRFLAYLVSRFDALAVTVVLARRRGEPGAPDDLLDELTTHPGARVLRPASLSAAAVGQLVAVEFPDAEPVFGQACARMSGGNPFLLHELLAEVAAEGVAPTAVAASLVDTLAPETVLRALLVRLARLGPGAPALARAVAVLGDGVALRQAARLAQLDDRQAAEVADGLAAMEILCPGEPLGFVHPVIASAVEADIPAAERRRAHLRAARLLADDGEPPARLAPHLLAGQAAGDPWVVDTLHRAASQALDKDAADVAVRFLERALAEPPPALARAGLLVDLGRAQLRLGRPAASATLDQALEGTDEPSRRAQIHELRSAALHLQGRHREAADACGSGLKDLGDHDVVLAQRLQAGFLALGVLDRRTCRVGPPTISASLAQANPIDDRARILVAQRAWRRALEGRPASEVKPQAEHAWAEGGLLAHDGPHRPAWTWVAGAFTCVGAWAEAAAVATVALDDALGVGLPVIAASAWCQRAHARYLQGRILDAQAEAELALAARADGWEALVGTASAVLALALVERSELDQAASALEVLDGPRFADSLERGHLLVARSRVRLAQNRLAEARDDARAAGSWFADFGVEAPAVWPWRAVAALACVQLGALDAARVLVAEHQSAAEASEVASATGEGLRLAGLVAGDPVAGVAHLEEAVAVLAGGQARLGHAEALVDLGTALARTGRRAEAKEPLGRALELADACGSVRLVGRARAALADLGARPRRTSVTGPASLTPSERRVAELAAGGMNNPRIAESLYVGVKAVEFHLGNTYRKLGIRSRTALSAALAPDDDAPNSGAAP